MEWPDRVCNIWKQSKVWDYLMTKILRFSDHRVTLQMSFKNINVCQFCFSCKIVGKTPSVLKCMRIHC